MDLVGDDASAVASYDVADAFELAPREDPAPRVVRLGEQQRARAVGEEPVEGVEVELGALGVGIDDQVDPLPAGDLGDRQLRRVAGDRHHDRPGSESTSRASRTPAVTSAVGMTATGSTSWPNWRSAKPAYASLSASPSSKSG